MTWPPVPPSRLTKVRGLLVGLAYGDALAVRATGAPGGTSEPGPLWRSGVSTQLAAFTAEGLIRASVRWSQRGICHPPSVVWGAYHRWAGIQGLLDGAGGEPFTTNGWLGGVPALARRRGSAGSTVRALRGGRMGTLEDPVTSSAGLHAVTRVLPLGAILSKPRVSLAGEIAALTHGHPDAYASAVTAVTVANLLVDSDGLDAADAVRTALEAGAATGDEEGAGPTRSIGPALATARRAAGTRPRDPGTLRALVPDGTALQALVGAAYLVECFPGPDQVQDAMAVATTAPVPEGVSVLTGAFLGALHGFDRLPIEDVADLELLWVMDTLARDMLTEAETSPGGTVYEDPIDPTWPVRYPGG